VARPADRIRENNRLFREANERIRAASSGYGDPVDPIPFLCECPQEDCRAIVRMSPDEYSSIRAHSGRYFTASGHEGREAPVGEVVARRNGYVLVEKP
jgi:hypothetical protein